MRSSTRDNQKLSFSGDASLFPCLLWGKLETDISGIQEPALHTHAHRSTKSADETPIAWFKITSTAVLLMD